VANFRWNKDLELAIPAIDGEHRELLAAMDRLQALVQAGAPPLQVRTALLQLVRLTRAHFVSEEAYMAARRFPRAAEHRMIHQGLLARLDAFVAGHSAGNQELGVPFFAFLEFWIASHIRGVDRLYAEHAPAPPGPTASAPRRA